MTEKSTEGNAPPSKSEGAEDGLAPDNLSMLDAVKERLEQDEDAPEGADDKTPDPNAVAPAEGDEEKEPAPDDQTDETELKSALGEDLTDEESAWVAANPQSRLAKRIGQLVKQRKEAEEALEAARTQQQKPNEDEPFQRQPTTQDNAFKEVETVEDLQKKHAEITEFVDWADDLLEEHEDAYADDVIFEQDDNQWTKKDIRQRLRSARKQKERDLPDRHRELQAQEQRKSFATQLQATTEKELPWVSKEDTEQAKKLNDIINDPELAAAMQAFPNLKWQMPYFMAHAVNSMTGAKPVAPDLKKAKHNPPAAPQSNAAAPSRDEGSVNKEWARLRKVADESGRMEDEVAARAFELANNL